MPGTTCFSGILLSNSTTEWFETFFHRVLANEEDNGNGRGLSFCRSYCRGAARKNHNHLTADQLGGQCSEPFEMTFRPAIFDGGVLAFDVANFVQASTEPRDRSTPAAGCRDIKKT